MSVARIRQLIPFLSTVYNIRTRVAAVNNEAGKRNASYNTVRQPLTDELLEAHFAGTTCINVQPLIEPGNICQWGCIDIDTYDEPDLIDRVRSATRLFGLKCHIEPTKSGGVHIYVLLDQPIVAAPFRRALKKLAIWLGFPRAEIRPAQDEINISEGDVGTFISYPCMGVGPEKAFTILSACVNTIDEFNQVTNEGEYVDGPPCLFPIQRLNEQKGEWSFRNNYLYQLGVFLRFKYPSDWAERLRNFNATVIRPSLPSDEVDAMVAQLERNVKCHYKCSDPQFESVCDRTNCMKRKYGVAARDQVGSIISTEGVTILETDPPTWFVTLTTAEGETKRVKLTTDELASVAKFKKRCMETIHNIPTLPNQKEWEALVANLLVNATKVKVPFEMSPGAILLDLLMKFALTSQKTADCEGLLHGKVWVEKIDGLPWAKFRMADLFSFLSIYGTRGISSGDIYTMLKDLESEGHIATQKVQIGPSQMEIWCIPMLTKYAQTKMEVDLDEA